VVDGVDLTIQPGEFACLLGPTGCGKSTLLNCIAGFVQPSRGSVHLDGREIVGPGPERGMVFQQHSLFPWKTVKANVAFGPLMTGAGRDEAEARARKFLRLVGLADFENHYPHMLSGGMQQRVGIARALANSPSVLLLDEPFGALDAHTRTIMQETLAAVWQEFRSTVVFVTHDVEEAAFLSDRILVMSASPGRLLADITVPLPRPRSLDVVTTPVFVHTKQHCLELIRGQTPRDFWSGGRSNNSIKP
jgi:NitT/TauT family transport system ATP-binding protein